MGIAEAQVRATMTMTTAPLPIVAQRGRLRRLRQEAEYMDHTSKAVVTVPLISHWRTLIWPAPRTRISAVHYSTYPSRGPVQHA